MANGRINKLALPNANGSAVNKIYVDSNFSTNNYVDTTFVTKKTENLLLIWI